MSQIGVQSLTTTRQEHGQSRSEDEDMEIEDHQDTGQDVGQDVEVVTQPPGESINNRLESVHTTASQPEIPVSTPHAIVPSVTSTLIDVAAQQSPEEFRDETNVKASKRQQPSPTKESLLKSPVRDDDAQCCPICFEPWSNSGVHRLASLACGHLFGRSCIERWLKAKSSVEKCPQCNAPARRKDIRNIYAKALKTIDTTERDRALADLEKEKSLRQKAEEAEARALLQYQLVKVECERLKTSLVQQQELLIANSQAVDSCTCRKVGPKTVAEATCQSFTSSKCYVLQRSCQISKGGSRVMAFEEHHAVLVISKQSSNQLYPGFGIAKVSSLDIKRSEFVQIHQKPIRDATFSNQGDGLLLTASMDKTLKITSLLSNTVVQSYNTPTPAWSCAWNNSDNNYMYCGLQNGSCLMFDVRNTNTYLKNLVKEGDTMCPVISLAHVMPDPNSSFRPGGVIVCKLGGACFWESTFGVDYVCHPLTLPEGSFTRLSYEPLSRHCMFSLRPSKHNNKTRHTVCQLQGNGIAVATARSQNEECPASQGSIITCNPIAQCTGGSIQKLLSRSILFTNPDNCEKLIVAAPDEGSKAVLLWDGESGHKFQKLPNQTDAVVDVLPFSVNGQNFLTSITEQKLDVYMWQ